MSRLSVGLITALLVVSVCAPAAIGGATAQEDTVTVTLSVVDSNGDPVGDTDLTVTWADGDGGPTNVTTAGNGKAFVDVPNGSDISVEIHDEEYIRNTEFRRNNVGEEEIEVQVAQSGQATITVEDQNGRAVADAEVRVREGSTLETLTTDENGQVTTSRLEQRSAEQAYELVVEKTGYFDLDSSIAVTGNVTKTVNLTSGTRTLTFRVVDDNFDPAEPIQGARIRIPDLETSLQTLENGEALTGVPVNREYTIQVNKDGYSSAGKRVAVEEENKDVTVAISRSNDLSIVSDNQRVVVGETTGITVTDEYGEPVSNAQVSVDGQNVGLTDSNGAYRVTINRSGNVTIEVSDDGQTASVTVEGVGGSSETTPTPDDPTPTPDTGTETPTPDTGTETPTPDTGTETPTPAEETTDDDTTAGGNGPGFGVAAAIAALAGAVFLARRR